MLNVKGKKITIDLATASGLILFFYGIGFKFQLRVDLKLNERQYDFTGPDGTYKIVLQTARGMTLDTIQSIVMKATSDRMIIGACAAADVKHELSWGLIKPLGISVARCWYDIGNFTKGAANRNIDRQCDFAAATGVDLFWTFGQENLKSDTFAYGWVESFAYNAAVNVAASYDRRPALKEKKIRFGLGNEINLVINGVGPYWQHKSTDGYSRTMAWIDQVQRPMYRVLKETLGDRVECGSNEITWDYAMNEKTADARMDCSDFDCFHPYPNGITGSELEKIIQPVKTAHSRGRKIVIPELMVNRGKMINAGKITFATAYAEAKALINICEAAGVDESHVFPAYDQGTTNSWPSLLRRVVKNNVTVGVEVGPGYSMLASTAMERKAA